MVRGKRKAERFRFPAEIEGYLSEDEGRFLYHLALEVPADGLIVELGSYKGRSTVCLAQAERRVLAVDHFKGEAFKDAGDLMDGVIAKFVFADHLGGHYKDQFMDNLRRCGVSAHVFPIVGDTAESARVVGDKPVDLLFIDSDHSYEHVLAEWLAWEPKMSPAGVVVFDDYTFPGPARLITEVVEPAGWRYFDQVGKDVAFGKMK